MIIFHIFNYFRSVIYNIIHNYKIFLADISLIAISFLISVMLIKVFYRIVSFLGGAKNIYRFELVKKSEFDNPLLTVRHILKKIYIPMLLNFIAGVAISFVLISGALTINLIADILLSPLRNSVPISDNLFCCQFFQIAYSLISNVIHNFIGIVIELVLLIFFVSYLICIFNIEDDAEYYFNCELKSSVGVMWLLSVISVIILSVDILCVITSNASLVDVMF